MHTPPLQIAAWSMLVLALVAVAVVDVRQRRIPNALALTIALGGVVHGGLFGGWRGALAALVGLAAGVALLYLPFARGWMGAGDVKLLGALGAFSGWLGAVWILLIGSVAGGVLSAIALASLARGERAEVGRNVMTFAATGGMIVPEPGQISRRRGVPFGVALALAGALVTLLGVGR